MRYVPRPMRPDLTISQVKSVIVVAVVALGTLACRQDLQATYGPQYVERDSAGVRIVENERPLDGSRLGWRIGPEPSVTVGKAEGEDPYLLHWAIGASKLSDGRFVVADLGSSEIRLFDASGTHIATWGGRGEGPGEISSDLQRVEAWTGDSVIAWYSGGGQEVSVFDSEGRFGRSFRLGQADRFRSTVGVRADGTILATAYAGGDDAVIEIWKGDGTFSVSLGKFPFREVYPLVGPGGRPGVAPVAYSLDVTHGLWGDLAFVAVTNRYEIRAFRYDGALARIVRRDHVPRATTSRDRDHYVEQHLTVWADLPPDQLKETRQAAEATPLAKTFPAFHSALADASGYLWVREYDIPGEVRSAPLWTVFDPGGRVLGLVETPKGVAVLEIGKDYILGRTVDALGVESIQVWPLDRSEG